MAFLLFFLQAVMLGSTAPLPAETKFAQAVTADVAGESGTNLGWQRCLGTQCKAVALSLFQVQQTYSHKLALHDTGEDGDEVPGNFTGLELDIEQATDDSRDSTIVLIERRAARTFEQMFLPMLGPKTRDLREQILQISVPVVALLLGSIAMLGQFRYVGMLLLYFGGQAGLSIYMKLVLSNASVSEELGYHGVPAAFAVTGIQQVVAFVFLAGIICSLYPTSYRYEVKLLTKRREYYAVFALSAAFAANIGLNNLSMSYLPVSTNVIIRSCVPLITYMIQRLASTFQDFPKFASASTAEVSLMVLGVLFAGLCAVAQTAGAAPSGDGQSFHMLGIIISLCSVAAGAFNLVLAAYLGSSLNFNPVDTTWYMALPAAVILFIIAFIPHPCDWSGFSPAMDWAIIVKVMQLSPATMVYILASGVMAGGYNVLMYLLVQTLSAPHAAFAGNVNKAATIIISLAFGLESLPQSHHMSALMIFAIGGNVFAFTAYSMVKSNAKHAETADQIVKNKQQHPGLPIVEKAFGKDPLPYER